MRDLQAERDLLSVSDWMKYPRTKEFLDRAIAAEAEVERLRGQVEKMRCCENCTYDNNALQSHTDCYREGRYKACDNYSMWEFKGRGQDNEYVSSKKRV